jgi:N-methylhydantoinase A
MSNTSSENRRVAGVDIGGTFTDLVLSADGQLHIHKLLSTPSDPSLAMLAGLREILIQTLGSDDLTLLEHVAHGSTVATNAILERKGARAALITTQGFRDLLLIGRQNRPELYALHPTLPPPLIPRERSFEVPERLDFTGKVLTPLDIDALDSVIDQIAALSPPVESVAVCLLYCFVNPAHEHAIRDRMIERNCNWKIILSSDVLPEFREYERASAAALEAYVRPVMSRYIARLQSVLPVPLRIMKSDGGAMDAAKVESQAIQTALSGPAAGVIGAYHLAKLAGDDQIITLDMGGTSTDVALCPGELVRRQESSVDGLPLRIRLLDIETVGAGGGSIARVDAGGALRVGPESAGADPGPIIYGRGGQQITVSDANAMLGRLNPARFLGGQMTLRLEPAQQAIRTLATQINKSVNEVALGVLAIANANIERAVRRVSVERGYDPRDFTLVAFGGAGGLHACDVAERLDMRRVLIPRYPGVLCAFGLLVADVTRDYSRSVLSLVDHVVWQRIQSTASELMQLATAEFYADGFNTPETLALNLSLDMRYQGQAYELSIPVDIEAAIFDPEWFHSVHERTYGFGLRDRAIEAVNVRVQAVGLTQKPVIQPEAVHEQMLTGREFEREELTPGSTFDGEALVYQLDSTLYVKAGWRAEVDAYRNLVLTRVDQG